jgi:glycerophosphoryl diester phosphodiesterase
MSIEDPTLTLPDKTKPYLMAHRGNRVVCPENTLAAFRQALADGADIIETDLHLTADDVIVCIHDATVDRTTDGTGPVASMTLAELETLSAAYGRPEFEAERIPTLTELVAMLPSGVALGLELKTDRFLEPEVCQSLVAELEQAAVRNRTVALSFSLPRLQAVQSIAPDMPIGWITLARPWPLREAQLLGVLWPLLFLNPFYVWLAHRRGQLVCPLDPTPNKRLRFYRWLGCDAVLSDDPGATHQVLQKLGSRS